MSKKYFLSENNLPFSDFFQFGLSVDCVVFGYNQGKIQVLLIERNAEPFKGKWALPGDLVSLDMDLKDAASTVLFNLTGLKSVFLEQFKTFGKVNRHPAGRVATVGYYALIKGENYNPIASSWAKSISWFDINKLPKLAFDHRQILEYAIDTIKIMVRYRPIGFELLPQKFTLRELQDLYEAFLGYPLDKPNFRKKILSMDLLIQLNETQENVAHRPAKLFRFDEKRYLTLKKNGFNFEL